MQIKPPHQMLDPKKYLIQNLIRQINQVFETSGHTQNYLHLIQKQNSKY